MATRRRTDVAAGTEAVEVWRSSPARSTVPRSVVGTAVRYALEELGAVAPGRSVEVRVPPFGAVQCIEGLRHTRGTPPNVVETDPRTWLLLVTGLLGYDDAVAAGTLDASGSRAPEIAHWLPLIRLV